MFPPHLSVPCHKLDAFPGLPRLLDFLLHRPPPCDLRAASLAFSFWRPMQSSFRNWGFLASDVANPPPTSPLQDGSHWCSSTPFKEIIIWDVETSEHLFQLNLKFLQFNSFCYYSHPTGPASVSWLRSTLTQTQFLFSVTWVILDVEMGDGHRSWRLTATRYHIKSTLYSYTPRNIICKT